MTRTVSTIAASFLLYVLLSSSTVEAHGNEVLREKAGPYEVVVAILPERPAIGTVHFSITPLDASDGQLVTQVKIWLTAYDEKGEPVYAARAVNLPATPHYYDTNVKFEEAGTWTIELTLEQESLGEASLSFPLEIEAPAIGAGAGGGFVFLGVFAVLIGGAVYLWMSARRATRAREESGSV